MRSATSHLYPCVNLALGVYKASRIWHPGVQGQTQPALDLCLSYSLVGRPLPAAHLGVFIFSMGANNSVVKRTEEMLS